MEINDVQQSTSQMKSGYLWKSGYTFKPAWRKRFFVLDGRRLSYFMNEKCAFTPGTSAKLTIYVQDGFEVPDVEIQPLGNGGNSFKIRIKDISRGSEVVLMAANEIDARSWISTLQGIVEGNATKVEDKEEELSGFQNGIYVTAVALDADLDDLLQAAMHHSKRDQLLQSRTKYKIIDDSLEAFRLKVESGAAMSEAEQAALERVNTRYSVQSATRKQAMVDAAWVDECLKDFDSNEGWTLQSSSDVQTVSSRSDPGSDFESVKIDTTLAFPLVHLAALFAEVDLLHLWVPFCSSATLLQRPTPMNALAHVFITTPIFVPLSNRDAVIEGRGVDMMDRSEVLIMIRSVSPAKPPGAAFNCAIPDSPSGSVRMDMLGGFQIKMLGENLVRMRIILNVDLKLVAVPASLLNFFNKKVAPSIVMFIKKVCRKFEGSEYKKRVVADREFYGDIEDRVADFLARKAVSVPSGKSLRSLTPGRAEAGVEEKEGEGGAAGGGGTPPPSDKTMSAAVNEHRKTHHHTPDDEDIVGESDGDGGVSTTALLTGASSLALCVAVCWAWVVDNPGVIVDSQLLVCVALTMWCGVLLGRATTRLA